MKRINIIICLILIVIISSGCIGGETQVGENIPKTTLSTTSSPLTTTPPKRTSILREELGIGYKDISVQELMKKMENNEDIIILDVRTPGEFEEGYIEGAILIPYTEVEFRHTELNAPKDAEIIVYCKAGVRSLKGAQQLTELGYTNVKEMNAGTDGWVEAGGKLVKPTTTTPSTSTTAPPTITPAPTITAPPTTTWAPTTTSPPISSSKVYFEAEPTYIIPTDKETQLSIDTYDILQIGDTLLSYRYDAGQCVALQTWEFSVFKKEGDKWAYETSVGYTEGATIPDIRPIDWSPLFHDKTDGLDNMDFVVKYGNIGRITITITPH